MKKISLLLVLFITLVTSVKAGDDKYKQMMMQNIQKLDSAMNPAELKALQNTFERIGNKETEEWLPNYYAAYALVKQTWMLKDGSEEADVLMDKADELLTKAMVVAKDPVADLLLMKTMINSARIMVNPMVRGREMGGKNEELMMQAKKLEPENPRLSLLAAQSLYFTPALFGGDKKKAKELFQKTIEQTKEYKPASDIHPSWGEGNATYFLSQYK